MKRFILMLLMLLLVICFSQVIYIEHIGCCGDKPIFTIEIKTDTMLIKDIYTKGKFPNQVVIIEKCNYRKLSKFVNANKTFVLFDENKLYLYGAFRIITVGKNNKQEEYVLLDKAIGVNYFKKMKKLKAVGREMKLYEKINTLVGRIDY